MAEKLKIQPESDKEIFNNQWLEAQKAQYDYHISPNEVQNQPVAPEVTTEYKETEISQAYEQVVNAFEKLRVEEETIEENNEQSSEEKPNEEKSEEIPQENILTNEIEKTPTLIQKASRLLADKLGITRRRRFKEQRRRIKEHEALMQQERAKQKAYEEGKKKWEEREAQTRKEREEREAQARKEREEREAQLKAEQERREKESLAKHMAEARGHFEGEKKERIRKQRIQEIVEKDLNSRLLSIENLEEEILLENSEVQKRFVEFENSQIPVYDLKGLAFSMLSTTIDYKQIDGYSKAIGANSSRAVFDDPAIWVENYYKVSASNGFKENGPNSRGDTISTSYRNSERDRKSYATGELIYGFSGVSADSIINIYIGDGATLNTVGKYDTKLSSPDIIDELEGPDKFGFYNEVLLRRYSETGQAKLPDYIIVEDDKVSEIALKHAKFFNIPIVNIENSIYREKAIKHGEEIIKSIDWNGDYIDINKKISELMSISEYGQSYYQRESIGRECDKLVIPRDLIEDERTNVCFELSNLEFDRRLGFIKDVLEKAIKDIDNATANGQKAQDFPQFDLFNVYIEDVQNGQYCHCFDDKEDWSRSVPGNCNSIYIVFRIKGTHHTMPTMIFDGENIYKLEEAIAHGTRTQEDIDNADSSYYKEIEPLVRDYFRAFRQNYKIKR